LIFEVRAGPIGLAAYSHERAPVHADRAPRAPWGSSRPCCLPHRAATRGFSLPFDCVPRLPHEGPCAGSRVRRVLPDNTGVMTRRFHALLLWPPRAPWGSSAIDSPRTADLQPHGCIKNRGAWRSQQPRRAARLRQSEPRRLAQNIFHYHAHGERCAPRLAIAVVNFCRSATPLFAYTFIYHLGIGLRKPGAQMGTRWTQLSTHLDLFYIFAVWAS
jgi:hypothetical protein